MAAVAALATRFFTRYDRTKAKPTINIVADLECFALFPNIHYGLFLQSTV